MLILLWVVFAFVIAIGARARGRSGFWWLLIAVLISPLIAALLLLMLPRKLPRCHWVIASGDRITVSGTGIQHALVTSTSEMHPRRWYQFGRRCGKLLRYR